MSDSVVPKTQFASDNTAGVCPEAWEAMERANRDNAPSYGTDAWTQRAADLGHRFEPVRRAEASCSACRLAHSGWSLRCSRRLSDRGRQRANCGKEAERERQDPAEAVICHNICSLSEVRTEIIRLTPSRRTWIGKEILQGQR